VTLIALLAVVALAPSPADATHRVPQAPVAGSGLQDYFDSIGESIDVRADQRVAQRWRTGPTGDDDPTVLQVELVRRSGADAVGLYDAGGSLPPRLFELFPGAGERECRAISSFEPASQHLRVRLFDRDGGLCADHRYDGLDSRYYGFYVSGPGGVGYSQDARQARAGDVRMLTFAGTGANAGGLWLCFETNDPADTNADPDYDDTILFVGPVDATPASRFSWSFVKALFR
jgi:hypothetical protein